MPLHRLDAPHGLLINRDHPIRFTFEGESYEGLQGDTLASALLANGQWLQSRSFKYHRPRGPLTMAGQDANTLIQLGGEPNVLADMLPLTDGLAAQGQNYAGSLQRDFSSLLGSLSRFLPVGFYYRAFFKPQGLWRFWEKVIRQIAGLGKLDLTQRAAYHDKQYRFYDVVVVGAGPAGLRAALTAADAGASVMLLDRQPEVGGALCYQRFDQDGALASSTRESLLAEVSAHPAIDVFVDATCNAWFSDNYLPVIQGNRLFKVRAQQCIVASGCYEQHVVFRNNDLPGVALASAVARMVNLYGVRPGKRAVVLGGNDDIYLHALDLDDSGIHVTCVIDMRRSAQQKELAEAVSARGIDVRMQSTVYEALATAGNRHLRGVEVRQISGRGQVTGESTQIDCDLLCMSAGYMPAYQLLCQAGAKLSYLDQQAAFSIDGLPDNLHIAGSVNGHYDLAAVMADGDYAAHAALHQMRLSDAPAERSIGEDAVNFDWPIFAHPDGKEFVDFDEDLQIADIVNATRLGYRDVQLVKRFSTVGMGPSQGRHSALATARLIADATDRSVSDTGVSTARPPFMPETLAVLAGRHFNPLRVTPMHHRHLEAGANMMPAGNWRRPAFYGQASERASCLRRESLAVRRGVGLIDISTLGGLEIYGPDAAEFMNRMYTFGFAKQAVGKTRYAVLTNEQGVVVDDGVACRLSEDHFYVSATTAGVDQVYRNMLHWNAQWRLRVDIVNVTSAFAAVNIAGPYSRSVLNELVEDVDLSSQGFPYLACRQGRVAGIPARLLRVGFVGELGYELHVPASQGEALWDALLAAGNDYGITPFGVETQRLLRLEKGHLIVGQDTDGMSHPGELGLEWAVSANKPFFVGKRSVEYLARAEQRRKLVGFTLPSDSTQPQEGHLVLDAGDISGNVTSCEYSPTMDTIIGLAYVRPHQSTEGEHIDIRVDGAELVRATVVPLPFYDPKNKRQAL
ncbi:MAG: 2Fe-2S iron-sulfur cluster-binding protein [Pseudomonadota bacterium]